MGFIETDVEDVEEKLKLWERRWYATETEYENALYVHLNEAFKKDKFERQYTVGKTRADIYVHFKGGAKVAIEVKQNLRKRTDYHRLVGQIWEYLTEWKVELLVILCGENDPALVKNVEDFVKFIGGSQPGGAFVYKKVRCLHLASSKPIAVASSAHASPGA